jgi:hypothetical protein
MFPSLPGAGRLPYFFAVTKSLYHNSQPHVPQAASSRSSPGNRSKLAEVEVKLHFLSIPTLAVLPATRMRVHVQARTVLIAAMECANKYEWESIAVRLE